ncbi:class I SAM-dependent methyltransferase [Tahibacter amnicola]|uniref:Class I SAM-dependent methyltransferase n=1 Tax=Tahibacter amnicola TaxID=2976241 RepID=A0ABY6BF91_9GAMM|nr:class I SAM-dependent methyltransferase [Tahibacter amnicola]UXI67775.1 class I SAM-dependent methyltransferase [Tahibacter amnicola]
MKPSQALEFTGERFTPECVREIWYEHWHRYAFVRPLAVGKRVLDAACGEGYGSALMAEVAASVQGLDIAEQAVAHARARYGDRPNLQFGQADATRLELPPGSMDLAVSFETLEHVERQDELLQGLARALTDTGLLVISSPDKATYSDAAGFQNEFHVRELYRDEFLALLARHFGHVRLYGQRLLFQSAIWPMEPSDIGHSRIWTAEADGRVVAGPQYPPVYYIAVCSRSPLPAGLPGDSWFGDRDESVYQHYNHEIRKNMAAGGRIAELEAEVDRLRTALDALEKAAAPPLVRAGRCRGGGVGRRSDRVCRRGHGLPGHTRRDEPPRQSVFACGALVSRIGSLP